MLDEMKFSQLTSLCRSEEHTSELQSPCNLVCRLLLEKKILSALELDRSTLARVVAVVGVLALTLVAAPAFVGTDWIFTFTIVAIYSVVALAFGVLYGRVGMISLGQVAALSVGCWIGSRFFFLN